jgi:adenosine deaminase CECR1
MLRHTLQDHPQEEPVEDSRPLACLGLSDEDRDQARQMVEVQEAVISKRRKIQNKDAITANPIERALSTTVTVTDEEYSEARKALKDAEQTYAFDYHCRERAMPEEKEAARVLDQMRLLDDLIFKEKVSLTGWKGQRHERFAGDHFLTNVDLIPDREVYKAAKKMPKGAHLHIHFNACLGPDVLLDIAAKMNHMVIMSDLPLTDNKETPGGNYDRCRITFQIEPASKFLNIGNLFHWELLRRTDDQKRLYTMMFKQFLQEFEGGYEEALKWLVDKLVFHEDETHNLLQTSMG